MEQHFFIPVPDLSAIRREGGNTSRLIRVHLVFNITRTEFQKDADHISTPAGIVLNPKFVPEPSLATPKADEADDYAHIVSLDATEKFDPAKLLEDPLILRPQGEPAELFKLVYETTVGLFYAWIEGCRLGTPLGPAEIARLIVWTPTDLSEHLTSVRRYIRDLTTVVEAQHPSRITHARRFFFDLDRRTSRRLLRNGRLYTVDQIDEIKQEATLTGAQLVERIKVRTNRCRHRCPDFPRAADLVLTRLGGLSEHVLGIFHNAFEDRLNRIDLASIEEAFEMFANGQLRLRVPGLGWTTQPSSGLYFHFGELALFALDNGVDSGVWSRLANVLVRTQRIYMRVYSPSGQNDKVPGDYNACHFDPSRQFTLQEILGLREEYRGLDLAGLHRAAAANARSAFPGLISDADGTES